MCVCGWVGWFRWYPTSRWRESTWSGRYVVLGSGGGTLRAHTRYRHDERWRRSLPERPPEECPVHCTSIVRPSTLEPATVYTTVHPATHSARLGGGLGVVLLCVYGGPAYIQWVGSTPTTTPSIHPSSKTPYIYIYIQYHQSNQSTILIHTYYYLILLFDIIIDPSLRS